MNFDDYSESVFSALPYFFAGKGGTVLVTKFTAVMRDPVDPAALRIAADRAAERYPYLSVTPELRDGKLFLVRNPRPLAVIGTDRPVKLCAPETNGHLHAVTYTLSRIEIHALHALYDGTGGNFFRETLLYYYCREVYGDTFETPYGVRLAGGAISATEYPDPYLNAKLSLPSADAGDVPTPAACYDMADDNVLTETERACHILRADEAAFAAFARKNNCSVFGMAALLFAKALARYRTGHAPIVLDYPVNLRMALGAPDAHHSAVGMPTLTVTDELMDLPLDKVGEAVRADIKSRVSEDSRRILAAGQIGAYGRMSAAPLPMIASGLRAKYSTVMSPYGIGYIGRIEWGSLSRYIRYVYSTANYPCRLMCQMNSFGGSFTFAFTQTFSEDKYIRALADELAKNGIPCEVELRLSESVGFADDIV